MAQTVKHLSAMQETWVQSLGREDPLEKEMATHSSILAWKFPGTEEPDGPHSMGPIRVGLNPATTNRSISKDHTRVCVCVCVCLSVCVPACGSSALSGRSGAWRAAWGQGGRLGRAKGRG